MKIPFFSRVEVSNYTSSMGQGIFVGKGSDPDPRTVHFCCLLCKAECMEWNILGVCRDSEDHHVIQCTKCGFIQIIPLPTEEENKEFYDKNLQEKNFRNEDIENARSRSVADNYRRIGWVERTKEKCSLLDVGCGYGFFVELAALHGYSATGVDTSSARQIPHKMGNFIHGTIDDVRGSFDVLTAFHVLEHMLDPVAFLKKCAQKSKILLIEVPNHSDVMMQACEAYKAFRWQRAHVSYFTPETLKAIFEQAGFSNFTIGTIQRYGTGNILHWLEKGLPQKTNIDWCQHSLEGITGDTLIATVHV